MSISYHGIIGNKQKGGLGSVESWGANNNITKDPPKSITTRRIDKVNEDGSLNELYANSGDRFAENINVFARNVNPMVSVEYGNRNGDSSGTPGKLPYRIMNAGAFRPPILTSDQLRPLSRQPRLVTCASAKKGFTNYVLTNRCESEKKPENFRQIKENVKGFITPTKSYSIQTPVKEHFVLNYVNTNPKVRNVNTSKSSKSNIQIVNAENVKEASKQVKNIAHTSNMNGQNGQVYVHNDIELERNLPAYMATTNLTGDHFINLEAENEYEFDQKTRPKHVITNLNGIGDTQSSSREYYLPDSLKVGGFQNNGVVPSKERSVTYNRKLINGKEDLKDRMKHAM
jgi:hypothetical protein